MKRNYKKEYRDYHGKPEQIRRRSLRNGARSALGLKKGDSRQAGHKKPLSKGGTNAKSNIRIQSKKSNLSKQNGTKNSPSSRPSRKKRSY